MDKPAEILLFDFLTEQIELAVPDDPLFQIELHDTVHQTITKDRGVRISEAVGELLPASDGEWKEFDATLIVTCYSRVLGKDKTQRQTALADVFTIQKAVSELIGTGSTLGNRVCDVLLRQYGRGYDVLDGEPYAVVNIPLVINPMELGAF
jgi:hypothetical protein